MPYHRPSIIEPFVRAISSLLRRVFDFRGRTTRTEFILGLIFLNFAGAAAGLVLLQIMEPLSVETLVNFGISLLGIAMVVRRVHDVGLSGWVLVWLLWLIPASLAADRYGIHLPPRQGMRVEMLIDISNLGWVAVLGTLAFLALVLWPPQVGSNRYGPNPRIEGEG